jgi:spore coat protein CotH
MSLRFWVVACAVAWPASAWAQTPAAEAPGKDLFGLTKVWQVHLEIPAKEWEKMQPISGMRFPGMPGGPAAPPKPPEKPAELQADRHKSVFGMEFPWVHGELTAGGKTIKNVGLRFKGNSSYMTSARGPKRPFKVDLNRYDRALRLNGLKAINLNNNAMDSTQIREALSYAVFRAAGVPAPRTAFAEVTLTVPGKYDKEHLGLYTLIEEVDKTFLKDRFKSGKGLLLKPEIQMGRMPVVGIEHLGDNWEKYQAQYQPKNEPSKKERQRLIDFARLISKADDEQLKKEVGSYLDVEEFLRYLAVNALLVNTDSYYGFGHNYYLYLNPETNKFAFIPWDLNLSFAGIVMGGSVNQQLDLSVAHPHIGPNKLIDRLLAIKEVHETYQKVLRELTTTCFTKEQLLKDIEAVQKTTREIIARETKATAARKEAPAGFGPAPGMFGQQPSLEKFVEKRTESVAAQLAGKSKGYIPTMNFGVNPWAKPLLEALDADKDMKVTKDELVAGVRKFFKDSDKDKQGSLDEKQLADGFTRIFPRPPGNPMGRGAGAPPDGRLGTFFARVVIQRADADKNGKVTLDELVTASEALFAEADKDKKGSLDEKQVGEAIGLLFRPPPAPKPAPPKDEKKKAKP